MDNNTIEWRGDDGMRAAAEEALPLLVELFSNMGYEQLEALNEFASFWNTNYRRAGHKNMFIMLPAALNVAVKKAKDESNSQSQSADK